jgi:hypothetical protein
MYIDLKRKIGFKNARKKFRSKRSFTTHKEAGDKDMPEYDERQTD